MSGSILYAMDLVVKMAVMILVYMEFTLNWKERDIKKQINVKDNFK